MKEFTSIMDQLSSEDKAMSGGQAKRFREVRRNLISYIEECGTPDVWEALFYCVGYYGFVDETHLRAVRDLVRQGKIIE